MMKARGGLVAIRFAAALVAALLLPVLSFAAMDGSAWVFLVPASFCFMLVPTACAFFPARAVSCPSRHRLPSRSRSPPAP
jgi:hypothetical protein